MISDLNKLVIPRNKKDRALWLDDFQRSAFEEGYLRGKKERPIEQRSEVVTQAISLLQEASKMMSRAGYLVDKANGVRP